MENLRNIHFVCGPVGAGKSTYSHNLAKELNGIVFSVDDWMTELFMADIPSDAGIKNMNPAWFAERVDRCEAMIWRLSLQVLSVGRVAILDMGFIRKARRDKASERAIAEGITSHLHYVTADIDVRRERVQARNAERGQTYAFGVTPEMFAFAEQMFEPLDESELPGAKVIRT
jgi:predicted kinase